MSFVTRECVQCGHGYEFYQVKSLVPDCPKCGALGGYIAKNTKDKCSGCENKKCLLSY